MYQNKHDHMIKIYLHNNLWDQGKGQKEDEREKGGIGGEERKEGREKCITTLCYRC